MTGDTESADEGHFGRPPNASRWPSPPVLAAPVALTEATVATRASVGIAIAGARLTSADVLRHADIATYAAKDGDLRVVAYTPDLDRGRAERLALQPTWAAQPGHFHPARRVQRRHRAAHT